MGKKKWLVIVQGSIARYQSGKPGPTLAFFGKTEYDALARHRSCLWAQSLGTYSVVIAASALQPYVDELGGESALCNSWVKRGAKMGLSQGQFCVREGFFEDVDAALCVHPAYRLWQNHTLIFWLNVSCRYQIFMVGHPMRQRHA